MPVLVATLRVGDARLDVTREAFSLSLQTNGRTR